MTPEQLADLLIQLIPSLSVMVGFLVSAVSLIIKVKAAFSQNKIEDLEKSISESTCSHDAQIKELKEQNMLLIQANNDLMAKQQELIEQISRIHKGE